MKTRKLLLSLLACSALLAPGRAQAQSSDRQALFTEAQEAIAARNWDDARRVLMTLWANEKTYDVALSLGQVEIQLQRHADAANHIAFGLRKMPPREGEELARRGKEFLDVAKQHVGSASISVTRPHAEIRIDSILIGTSPLEAEWFLEPGRHVVQARLTDGAVAEKTIDVRSGAAQRVELDPRSDPNPATQPSSPADTGPDSGSPKAAQSSNTLPLYLGGGAVLGVGVGVGFLIAAKGKDSDKDEALSGIPGTNRCGSGTTYETQCSRARSLAEDAQTFRTIGYVGLGVGIAAGATALVLLAFPTEDHAAETPSKTLALVPHVAPGNVGAAVTGEF